jgi:hypothetical protein
VIASLLFLGFFSKRSAKRLSEKRLNLSVSALCASNLSNILSSLGNRIHFTTV